MGSGVERKSNLDSRWTGLCSDRSMLVKLESRLIEGWRPENKDVVAQDVISVLKGFVVKKWSALANESVRETLGTPFDIAKRGI